MGPARSGELAQPVGFFELGAVDGTEGLLVFFPAAVVVVAAASAAEPGA